MNNILIYADIYFFITSVSVVLITFFILIFLFYMIRILRRFDRLSAKIEQGLGSASEGVLDMVDQVRESFWFNFLFPKKRNKRKNN